MSCQSCNGCEGCNTCQSCNGCQATCEKCQGCNICQKCNDGCQVTCDTSQAFCAIGGQGAGTTVNWATCQGETIDISASSYNSLLNHIRSAYSRGATANCAGSYSGQQVSSGELISAAKISNLVSNIWGLGGTSYSQPNIEQDGLITSDIFSTIVNGARTMRYRSYQCDSCNSACNGGCNECQTCNTGCNVTCNACQGCNTCQSCNNNMSTCWNATACEDKPKE